MSEVQSKTNEEVVKEFLAGQREADSLTEEQLDLALTGNYEFEETEETEEQLPVEEPSKEVEQPKEEEPLPIEKDIPEFDKHKEYKEMLARANKYEQLYNDRENKLKKMKEDPEFAKKQLGLASEVKVDENFDYLDDKYLATLKHELDELKKWKRNYEDELNKTRYETEKQKEQFNLFSEIQEIQDEFPLLKTSESFKSIDEKFVKWQSNVISAGLDPDKYLSDKEYKKQLDSKGYTLNVKDSDIPKVLDIYNVYSEYKKEKESGYSTSFKRALKVSEVYDKAIRHKYAGRQIADDDAINEAIERRSSEPVLLDSSNVQTGSMDFADVVNELEILSGKTQKSPSDRKRIAELDRIMEQYF